MIDDSDFAWLSRQAASPSLPVLSPRPTIDRQAQFIEAVIASDPQASPLARIQQQFATVPERLVGEVTERVDLAKRSLRYHVSFLDDLLRGMLPHDLVLLGADTGVGKTQLAMHIAALNAQAGKRVTYFALEAEPREIERRLKYRLINAFAAKYRLQMPAYVDWFLGNGPDWIAEAETGADEALTRICRTLKTYYRRGAFGVADIRSHFMAVRDESDLIVLDHAHFLDLDDDKGENAGFKEAMKTLRDVSLQMGVPTICIAHLKKRGGNKAATIPHLDDFHGSSDATKIATHAIMFSRAPAELGIVPGIARTLMHVPKDRRGGATGIVGLLEYDLASQRYRDDYQVGRMTGDTWTPITDHIPGWAKRNTNLYTPSDMPIKKVSAPWQR